MEYQFPWSPPVPWLPAPLVKATSAQAAVRSAQAAYDAAVKSAGTSTSQLESAAAALQKAEANVQQAQAKYDQVASNPDIARRPESLSLCLRLSHRGQGR